MWGFVKTGGNGWHWCIQALEIWALIQYKDAILTSIGNLIVETRWSSDHLISTMGCPILERRHLYIESGPWLYPEIEGFSNWLIDFFCISFWIISFSLGHSHNMIALVQQPWKVWVKNNMRCQWWVFCFKIANEILWFHCHFFYLPFCIPLWLLAGKTLSFDNVAHSCWIFSGNLLIMLLVNMIIHTMKCQMCSYKWLNTIIISLLYSYIHKFPESKSKIKQIMGINKVIQCKSPIQQNIFNSSMFPLTTVPAHIVYYPRWCLHPWSPLTKWPDDFFYSPFQHWPTPFLTFLTRISQYMVKKNIFLSFLMWLNFEIME